ncbi:MAG: hypothetical protein HUK23_06880 [Sphaerochaetaceae bacterium]|nr:hypothetical protein [Sphaerochaetaceae bacterium]
MNKLLFAICLSLLLVSCATTTIDTPEPAPEVIPIELILIEESSEAPVVPETPVDITPQVLPDVEAEPTPSYAIGDIGPNGNLVFICNDKFYEIGEPVYEVSSYEAALDYCASIDYCLPSVEQLLCIYEQLIVTELADIDWTYYWSCEELGDSARIVNFDTGYEGSFYKNLDLVSLLPVIEL